MSNRPSTWTVITLTLWTGAILVALSVNTIWNRIQER